MVGVDYQYWQESHFEGQRGESYHGASVPSRIIRAQNDPYPPDGSIVINGGARATTSRLVTLSIIADDRSPGHGDLDEATRPGDGSDDLLMRISNSADFMGAAWQPYASVVAAWDLGDLLPGEQAVVYVAFKDTSGNVGAGDMGQFDTILYESHRSYLPAILRQ